MAPINYLLFAVLIITPFVENAPSRQKKSSQDELLTRLIFVDNDNNSINSNSPSTAARTALNLPKVKDETQIIGQASSSKDISEPVPANTGVLLQVNSTTTKMIDERQNWGLVAQESTDLPEDESYYNRPLTIPRIFNTKIQEPEKTTKVQNRVVKQQVRNTFPKPSDCILAIVPCCGTGSALKECFRSQRCFSITEDMLSKACSRTSIESAIEIISKYYRGVRQN